MTVYPPDTEVYCDPEEEVEGTIIRVFIESDSLTRYRVQYWANGQAQKDTFRESELTPVNEADRKSVGFSNGEPV